MKYSHAIRSLLFLSLTLIVFGCSVRPVERIEQTEKARQEAKEQYADQFALEDWSEAEKAWAEAEDALGREDYGRATTALLRAKDRYTKARDIAQGQKDALIKEVEGLKNTIQIRSKALVDSASEKRLSASQQKALDEAHQDFQSKIQEITEKLDAGEFNDAKLLAQRTIRRVWEVEQEFKE